MHGAGLRPRAVLGRNRGRQHWRSIEVTNRVSRALVAETAAGAPVEASDPLAKAKIVVPIQ